MKNFSIQFLIFPVFVLMISCLGEGSNTVEYGGQPGVVSIEAEETFIYNRSGQKLLPSKNRIDLEDGDCVLINYKADTDDVQSSSFYSVELTSDPIIVNSHELVIPLSESIDTILNEKIISTFNKNTAFIQNKLFLYPTFSISDSLTIHNFYKMSYDKNQVPIQDSTLNYVDVYKLYLRVQLDTLTTPTKTGLKSHTDINAFDIEKFVNEFVSEIPKDSTNMYIRIQYAKSFNSDSTAINWSETQSFPIRVK